MNKKNTKYNHLHVKVRGFLWQGCRDNSPCSQ